MKIDIPEQQIHDSTYESLCSTAPCQGSGDKDNGIFMFPNSQNKVNWKKLFTYLRIYVNMIDEYFLIFDFEVKFPERSNERIFNREFALRF